MDDVTLKKILEEINEACTWLRGKPMETGQGMATDFFGVGVVAERRKLSRPEVDEVLTYLQDRMNRQVAQKESEEFWRDVFARTYVSEN